MLWEKYHLDAMNPVIYGTYTNGTGDISSKWSRFIEGIARANLLLQNIDKVDMADSKLNIKEKPNSCVLFTYFQLLDFWGGVPLYGEAAIISDDFMNMKKPRSSAEEGFRTIHFGRFGGSD